MRISLIALLGENVRRVRLELHNRRDVIVASSPPNLWISHVGEQTPANSKIVYLQLSTMIYNSDTDTATAIRGFYSFVVSI